MRLDALLEEVLKDKPVTAQAQVCAVNALDEVEESR